MFTCSCPERRHPKRKKPIDTVSERHALYSGGVCGCGKTFTLVEWGEHFRQEQANG